MKKFTKLSKVMFALLVLLALPLSDAMSQDFIMQTGTATYNATCGGVIKMKNTAGTIVKNNSNPLGDDAANAIKGVVDWAATTVVPQKQLVKGLWYERMVLSGGAEKDVENNVYITGDACGSPLIGYTDLTTYPFYLASGQVTSANNFAGTINFVGATQTIFPATGDDAYVNVNLGIGDYSVPTGTTTVEGTLALNAAGSLAVDGTLFTGLASTLAGEVTITNAGVVNVNETITLNGALAMTGAADLNTGVGGLVTNGVVTITGPLSTIDVGAGDVSFNANVNVTNGTISGSGLGDINVGTSSTLALGATTAILNLGNLDSLNITGAITNSFSGSTGANLLFACGSAVTYNGSAGQLILPTLNVDGNRYGNLVLSGTNKIGGTATYGNNVNICNDFSLEGGNLDMVTNAGWVNMHSVTGLARYGAGPTYTGTEEVVGSFRRSSLSGATLATDYTLNNYKTTINFSDLPAGDFYQLNVKPNTNPNQYVAATDVKRKITATYDVSAMVYTLKVGYLNSENPTYPTVGDNLAESDLKFFEADAANTTSEKIAGIGYGRNTTDNLHSLSLGGLKDGGDAVEGTIERVLASSNDLILRANNTMYSIVNGRWSNPNVWDEGRIPVATDNVEVRTMVYVGIDGPFAGTTGGTDGVAEDNMKAEFADYGTNPAANKITIGNYTNATLIVGNEDNGLTYVHKTGFNGTAFINNNTTTTVNGSLFTLGKGAVVPADANGLWITGFINIANTFTPVFGTKMLENKGAINNQGIIEIGD